MIKKTSILTVSIVAVMAVCSAHADIASTTYVDTQVQSVDDKLTTHADNIVTATGDALIEDSDTMGSTTKYPSMATMNSAIGEALSETTGNVAGIQNTMVKHAANTAVGSATTPVYVDTNGNVVAITSYSGTAARATADTDGNPISSTYATKDELSLATTGLSSEISGKQAEITSTAKLNSDLVDDTNQTHKFVTAEEKAAWNAKQAALDTDQMAAVNSGITPGLVGKISSNESAINILNGTGDGSVANKINSALTSYSTTAQMNAALEGKANTGDIPTVNNATLTIQKNGTNVATFTANQGTAATANITVPTQPSDIGAATAAQGAKADAAIPAPTLTQLASDGTLVLTAKQGTGNTVVYAWEEIGR